MPKGMRVQVPPRAKNSAAFAKAAARQGMSDVTRQTLDNRPALAGSAGRPRQMKLPVCLDGNRQFGFGSAHLEQRFRPIITDLLRQCSRESASDLEQIQYAVIQ